MRAAVGAEETPNGSFEARAMQLCGTELVADRSGALYIPAARTLVVADLHLEKGSSFAARHRALLPPYDSRETLTRLGDVAARYRPLRVVALGDSLHDRTAERRLGETEMSVLRHLQARRDWIWITGNHDREIPSSLGGAVAAELTIGGLSLRHEPSPDGPPGEVAGHLHPAARVRLHGTGLRGPCFVGSAHRLLLPAFGAFTGGLNVLDEAFAPFFVDGRFEVHLLGRAGVYPVTRAHLVSD